MKMKVISHYLMRLLKDFFLTAVFTVNISFVLVKSYTNEGVSASNVQMLNDHHVL